MADRGPGWSQWVRNLPATVAGLLKRWALRVDGNPSHGYCSLVVPVRTDAGVPAMLKVGFPDEESEHEHLALRRWAGDGAVRLLSADPPVRALLLERLAPRDLTGVPDLEACRIVGGLYRRIHLPPLAQARSLAGLVERANAGLRTLPRSAPIPRRFVEQAVSLGTELTAGSAVTDRLLHTDLHYANVLAGTREPWLVIDPKPLSGDPHYELAPMLWNRYRELAGDVGPGIRRRLWTLVESAALDDDRARAWVLVRMVHNAMWELDSPHIDRTWLTVCVTIAKAVQD